MNRGLNALDNLKAYADCCECDYWSFPNEDYKIVKNALEENEQYKAVEDKLEIDLKLLPTLLKIKKGDKIYVIDGTLVEAEVTDNSMINGKLMVFSHYPYKGIMYTPVCYYSEYGKTWALAKEELL